MTLISGGWGVVRAKKKLLRTECRKSPIFKGWTHRRNGERQERGRTAKQKQSHTALGEERKWSTAANRAGKKVPEKMILDLATSSFRN